MVATNGDIPQNVNFAIKASMVTSFMETNGVAYTTGGATQPIPPADLADQAKAMSAFIECQSSFFARDPGQETAPAPADFPHPLA